MQPKTLKRLPRIVQFMFALIDVLYFLWTSIEITYFVLCGCTTSNLPTTDEWKSKARIVNGRWYRRDSFWLYSFLCNDFVSSTLQCLTDRYCLLTFQHIVLKHTSDIWFAIVQRPVQCPVRRRWSGDKRECPTLNSTIYVRPSKLFCIFHGRP